MSNNLDELEELTPRQRIAGNITAGIFVIACGIFLLLCGVNVIPVRVTRVLVFSLLLTVGLVLFVTGLIQKNSVSLWLAFVFLLPALVEVLNKFAGVNYSALYPIYIAIPAVASLFTMFMTLQWRDHIYVILFFGIIASVFALQSSGLLGLSVVVPIIVILVGAFILYIALRSKRDKTDI